MNRMDILCIRENWDPNMDLSLKRYLSLKIKETSAQKQSLQIHEVKKKNHKSKGRNRKVNHNWGLKYFMLNKR